MNRFFRRLEYATIESRHNHSVCLNSLHTGCFISFEVRQNSFIWTQRTILCTHGEKNRTFDICLTTVHFSFLHISSSSSQCESFVCPYALIYLIRLLIIVESWMQVQYAIDDWHIYVVAHISWINKKPDISNTWWENWSPIYISTIFRNQVSLISFLFIYWL
jgi:hypothetical protein